MDLWDAVRKAFESKTSEDGALQEILSYILGTTSTDLFVSYDPCNVRKCTLPVCIPISRDVYFSAQKARLRYPALDEGQKRASFLTPDPRIQDLDTG